MHLKAAFTASHQSDGSRRLVIAPGNQGIHIGRYKARRLMRQAGLKPVWKRKFIHTTDSKHSLPIAANILARMWFCGGHAERNACNRPRPKKNSVTEKY